MIQYVLRSTTRLLAPAILGLAAFVGGLQAAEESRSETFAVMEFRVLGNTVLPATDIETTLYPLLGDGKTIADVEAARQALEILYRDRGYGALYVDIPEQDVEEGVVRLRVTEGHLERVRVKGARYFSNRRILAALPALEPGGVLRLPELQKELAQLNQQSRDREVVPVLKGGQTPGSVDIDLMVKDSPPFHGSVEVTNRYTANTTQTRLGVTASYDNLFEAGHSLSLQYQGSPEDFGQVRMLGATYVLPVGDAGNVLALYGVDTNSDFAAVGSSAALGILGTGRIVGARYIVRLLADRSSQHTLTFGTDYKDFIDSIRLASGTTDRTPIRYVAWTAGYGGNWRGDAVESGPVRTTAVNISANFGMRGLVNTPAAFDYKRYNARPNYFHVRADAQHEQPIGAGNSLFLRAAGQWSPEPLISNEQQAIGGADSVRGYLESEALGDLGGYATVEWHSPSFHGLLGEWAQRLMALAFVDGGIVRTLDGLPNAAGVVVSERKLASAGAGLRFSAFHGLTWSFDWAYPFISGEYTVRGDTRLHLQVRYGF
jgi:hemolysin activation/secretion protein